MAQGPTSDPVPTRGSRAAAAGESDTERAVRHVAPWVASVGLHAGVVALGFLVTWTVMSLAEDREPVRVTADFHNLSYDPLVTLNADVEPIDELEPPETTAIEPLEQALSEQLADLEAAPLSLVPEAPAPPAMVGFAPPVPHDSATFVGLTTTQARRIVYVIDASGSMIRSLQIVLEELARSLDALTGQQSFGVIFFQHNDAVVVPPTNRLVAASSEAKLEALEWIDENVIPAGRSNPLEAIERALGLEPQVIFLLSENITGSGQFEIDQAELLELLEQLNPTDSETGRRATQINCVQFLYPDPLDTLRKIAERHGGPKGYKFLDAAELGIVAP
ncbi:MAG: vWA domain-containing protein [Planctomycetota bacterium]